MPFDTMKRTLYSGRGCNELCSNVSVRDTGTKPLTTFLARTKFITGESFTSLTNSAPPLHFFIYEKMGKGENGGKRRKTGENGEKG